MKRSIYLIFLFLIAFSSCIDKKKENRNDQYVIVLSMDGFRWDYPEKANTPNLDYVEQIGVRAESSIPCFPTKTFPNHYSMATGLYPDHHGIVFNKFYAPDVDKFYSLSDSFAVVDPDFYLGEPIWVTAEKQGIKSAAYYWVGSEAPHDGILPSYYNPYNGSVSFEKRMEGVLDWLKLPEEERPRLIMWYVEEPDSKGHDYGPDHIEIVNTVEYLDSLVGVFNQKIAELPFADQINVIYTSDHGMGNIYEEKSLYLYDLIQKDWCVGVDGGNPVYSIDAKEEYYDTIYNILSSVEHITVWKKEEILERLNFGSSQRIKDYVVLADSSWSLWKYSDRRSYSGGAHGFDNSNTDMHAIFYAYGPAFKNAYKHHSINNIDLYPLICELLKIDPRPVDGQLENVKPMLIDLK